MFYSINFNSKKIASQATQGKQQGKEYSGNLDVFTLTGPSDIFPTVFVELAGAVSGPLDICFENLCSRGLKQSKHSTCLETG